MYRQIKGNGRRNYAELQEKKNEMIFKFTFSY